MSEYVDSLAGQLRERFNSPLLMSFSISWVAWNYKIFFVLFSDLKPASKFDLIKELYPTALDSLDVAVFYPTISALAFILVYPFASRQLLRYSLWQQAKTQKVKTQGVESQILLPEQVKQLRLEYREQLERAEAEVDRKTEQASRYKAERDKAEAALVDEKASSYTQITQLELIASEGSTKIANFERELKVKSELVDALSAGTADLKAQLDSVLGHLQVSRQDLESRDIYSKQLLAKIDSLESQCDSSVAELERQRKLYAASQEAEVEMEKHLVALRVIIDSQETKIKELREVAVRSKDVMESLIEEAHLPTTLSAFYRETVDSIKRLLSL